MSFKVIWRKATSPTTCHPSQLRMDSSDLDSSSNTWFLGPTLVSPSPKLLLDRFSRLCTARSLTRMPNTDTHGQTCRHCTLRAISVSIGRISRAACRHCGPKRNEDTVINVNYCYHAKRIEVMVSRYRGCT